MQVKLMVIFIRHLTGQSGRITNTLFIPSKERKRQIIRDSEKLTTVLWRILVRDIFKLD